MFLKDPEACDLIFQHVLVWSMYYTMEIALSIKLHLCAIMVEGTAEKLTLREGRVRLRAGSSADSWT